MRFPLTDGSSDGVVTVEETLLSTRHHRLHVSAPHMLLCRHPGAIRSALAFIEQGAEGCGANIVSHGGYIERSDA